VQKAGCHMAPAFSFVVGTGLTSVDPGLRYSHPPQRSWSPAGRAPRILAESQ